MDFQSRQAERASSNSQNDKQSLAQYLKTHENRIFPLTKREIQRRKTIQQKYSQSEMKDYVYALLQFDELEQQEIEDTAIQDFNCLKDIALINIREYHIRKSPQNFIYSSQPNFMKRDRRRNTCVQAIQKSQFIECEQKGEDSDRRPLSESKKDKEQVVNIKELNKSNK